MLTYSLQLYKVKYAFIFFFFFFPLFFYRRTLQSLIHQLNWGFSSSSISVRFIKSSTSDLSVNTCHRKLPFHDFASKSRVSSPHREMFCSVDGSSEQPEYEFDAIRLELEMFNPDLAEKTFIVAYNKMDLPEASENWPGFKKVLQARGIQPFCVSAVTRVGTRDVITHAYELVRKNKEQGMKIMAAPVNLNHVADRMHKQRAAPISEFDITHDSSTYTWHVDGAGLQRVNDHILEDASDGIPNS